MAQGWIVSPAQVTARTQMMGTLLSRGGRTQNQTMSQPRKGLSCIFYPYEDEASCPLQCVKDKPVVSAN